MSMAHLSSEGPHCLHRTEGAITARSVGGDEDPKLRLWRCSELGWRLGVCLTLSFVVVLPLIFCNRTGPRWQCRGKLLNPSGALFIYLFLEGRLLTGGQEEAGC